MFNDLVLSQPGFEPRFPHARRMFYLPSHGQFILNTPPPALLFITITGIFRNFTEKERSVSNNCNKYLYNNADTLTGVLDV